MQIQFTHYKLLAAIQASLPPRAPFHFQPQTGKRRFPRQRLKRKIQRILIHIRKLANAHTHGRESRVRPAPRLRLHTFQYRRRNPHFVHIHSQ
jgi:hypothetical protein